MKILYFAWLREKAGLSGETVSLPPGVEDIAGLIEWMRGRGANFAAAFENPALVRAAVNQDFARPDHPVTDDDEVAFFPPITGGGEAGAGP